MIESYYNFVHSIGFHLYTIPCIIVLVVIVIIALGHYLNQKKRNDNFRKELDQELEGLQNGAAATAAAAVTAEAAAEATTTENEA